MDQSAGSPLDKIEQKLQVDEKVDVTALQKSMSVQDFADLVKKVNQDQASCFQSKVKIESTNGKTFLTKINPDA